MNLILIVGLTSDLVLNVGPPYRNSTSIVTI